MIVYELMSTGHIARLPDRAVFPEVPSEEGEPIVSLLMPYNRVLVGLCHMDLLEKWLWGKPGDPESWREAFLYDHSSCHFNVGDVLINLDRETSSRLRSVLLKKLPPPGNHMASISILKGFLGDSVVFNHDLQWDDEAKFISGVSSIPELSQLRLVYWGVRKALSLGDYSMIGRIKIWARRGMNIFKEEPVLPRMWMSAGKLPGNKGIEELEALLFKPDQLRRMSLEKNSSVVFKGDSGYLIRFAGQRPFGELSVAVWMYFPFYMWDHLKDNLGFKPQEIVTLSWGYLDAYEAAEEMERYCSVPIKTARMVR